MPGGPAPAVSGTIKKTKGKPLSAKPSIRVASFDSELVNGISSHLEKMSKTEAPEKPAAVKAAYGPATTIGALYGGVRDDPEANKDRIKAIIRSGLTGLGTDAGIVGGGLAGLGGGAILEKLLGASGPGIGTALGGIGGAVGGGMLGHHLSKRKPKKDDDEDKKKEGDDEEKSSALLDMLDKASKCSKMKKGKKKYSKSAADKKDKATLKPLAADEPAKKAPEKKAEEPESENKVEKRAQLPGAGVPGGQMLAPGAPDMPQPDAPAAPEAGGGQMDQILKSLGGGLETIGSKSMSGLGGVLGQLGLPGAQDQLGMWSKDPTVSKGVGGGISALGAILVAYLLKRLMAGGGGGEGTERYASHCEDLVKAAMPPAGSTPAGAGATPSSIKMPVPTTQAPVSLSPAQPAGAQNPQTQIGATIAQKAKNAPPAQQVQPQIAPPPAAMPQQMMPPPVM